MIKQLNGIDFERMLRNGLANLRLHEQEVNDLNVFPVPDGDTGTNMRLTLENGLAHATSKRPSGAYLKNLSDGMLLGARGNSGVILSQLWKGIFLSLCHNGWVSGTELRDALIKAYKTAYSSVAKPQEGTLLTVAREAAEKIKCRVDRSTPADAVLFAYYSELKKSLARTPELLPVLKEAGVVDSGARGWVLITEGMVKALRGEIISADSVSEPKKLQDPSQAVLFNADSPFTDGYCTEFVLQLMHAREYSRHFSRDGFAADLEAFGDSLVCVQDGDRVKVHIHSRRPEKIIALAREYGEFISFKLENMQLQHSERNVRVNKGPRRDFARIAVVSGTGMLKLCRELGCEDVIDGGRTLNTSAQEFLEAFSRVNAGRIAVLPGNKNTAAAARQAAEMYPDAEVEVLDAFDGASVYYALCMDVPDSEDIEYRLSQLKDGAERADCFSAAEAAKDSCFEGISIENGQSLVFYNGKLAAAAESPAKGIADALCKAAKEGRDYESLFVFCRNYGDENAKNAISAAAAEFFPMAEVNFFDGGQPVYAFVIGAV